MINVVTSKEKAVSSFFWSFAERFGQQGIQFFFSLILARLLVPADFGLIGMLALFMVLAQVVVDAGFGQALVQKKEISDRDISTVFWFNLAVGAIMTLFIYASAPWIAHFYDNPILIKLTRLCSLQILLASFGVVQGALLQRDLLFNQRAKITLFAVIISGGISVTLAYLGFGVWALAWQLVVYNALMTAGYWVLHPWKPRFLFCKQSFGELYGFGSKMFFSACLDQFFLQLTPVLIGKFYTPALLGFFSRARQLVQISSNSITGVLGQVTFPMLSRINHDLDKMVSFFRQVLVFSMILIAPIMIGLCVVRSGFIEILLGEKWLPCVPYLIPACVVGLTFPVQYLNLNVLMALGRSDLFLKLEIVKKSVMLGFIILTVRHGVLAMAWGQACAAVIALLLNSGCVGRTSGCGVWRQLRDLQPVFVSTACMGVAVSWVKYIDLPVGALLLVQLVTGAGIYLFILVLLAWFFPRNVHGKILSHGKELLWKVFSKRAH